MNDLVSIIVPVYNVENYIFKCLSSIINQSYKNLEILIVDDGSEDNSINIAKELIDGRCVILKKENGGLSSARNYGLKRATGSYIMFVDSDDWLEKNAIELLLTNIKKNNADIVQGEAIYFYENHKKIDELAYGLIENDKLIEYFRQTQIKTYVWNKLYKKEIIKNIFFQEGYINEDIIYTYEICKLQPKVFNINIPIYNYVQRENSIMHKSTLKKRNMVLKSHDFVIKKCKDNLIYKNLALLNKYISCIYLLVDLKNNQLKYTKKDLLCLKENMKASKSDIEFCKIVKYLNKKSIFIYLISNISLNVTTLLFNIWRRE